MSAIKYILVILLAVAILIASNHLVLSSEPRPAERQCRWECITNNERADLVIYRARVQDGWLVSNPAQEDMIYVPDKSHLWLAGENK